MGDIQPDVWGLKGFDTDTDPAKSEGSPELSNYRVGPLSGLDSGVQNTVGSLNTGAFMRNVALDVNAKTGVRFYLPSDTEGAYTISYTTVHNGTSGSYTRSYFGPGISRATILSDLKSGGYFWDFSISTVNQTPDGRYYLDAYADGYYLIGNTITHTSLNPTYPSYFINEGYNAADTYFSANQLWDIGSTDIKKGYEYLFSAVSRYAKGSIGEFGILRYNGNAGDGYVYTPLLITKDFNFTTQKQLKDVRVYPAPTGDRIHFTDGNNIPRKITYRAPDNGIDIPFGALKIIDPRNSYVLGQINNQIALEQRGGTVQLSLGPQGLGGNVQSGMWRYSVCFKTFDLVSSPYAQVTNQIPVFSASSNDVFSVHGDAVPIYTSKINAINVTGADPSLYKYVELIAIHYVGGAVEAKTVSRTLLTTANFTLYHTGNEKNITDFDLTNLYVNKDLSIATAGSMELIDNTLLLGNVSYGQNLPLTFSPTFSTFIKTVPSMGQYNSADTVDLGYSLAEYYDPSNVSNFGGYMENQTEYFGIMPQYLNGVWGPVYPISAYKIDSSNGTGTYATLGTPYSLNIRGVKISGLDISPFQGKIKAFRIVRAVSEPEVLFTGLLTYCYKGPIGAAGAPADNYLHPTALVDFNGTMGSHGQNFQNTTKDTAGAILSPDLLYGLGYAFKSGDQIRYCRTTLGNNQIGRYACTQLVESVNTAFVGVVTQTLQDGKQIAKGGSAFLNDLNFGNTQFQCHADQYVDVGAGLGFQAIDFESMVAVSVNSGHIWAGTFDPCYYVQYIRPNATMYQNPAALTYIPIGHFQAVDSTTPNIIPDFVVYGGDTFIQKSFIKHSYYNGATQNNYGTAISFWSQNRYNSQLHDRISDPGLSFPYLSNGTATSDKLFSYLVDVNHQRYDYDKGYNYDSTGMTFTGFDPNDTSSNLAPTRIHYSLTQPENSVSDFLSQFRPLDFHDESLAYGAITALRSINGKLYVWQRDRVSTPYFNSQTVVNSQNATSIVIGDGDKFRAKSEMISAFGTTNGQSIVKARTKEGREVVYFVDANRKAILRIAEGQETNLSINTIESYLAILCKWNENADNPIENGGICGVWDGNNQEVLWTFRSRDQRIGRWEPLKTYATPASVYYDNYTIGGHLAVAALNDTGLLYTANNGSTGRDPSANLYNDWNIVETPLFGALPFLGTLVFSERAGVFMGTRTFTPRSYIPFGQTYLVPMPRNLAIYNSVRCFLYAEAANVTGITGPTFFDNTYTSVLSGFINTPLVIAKRFISIQLDAGGNIPNGWPNTGITFSTPSGQLSQPVNQLERRNNLLITYIGCDIDTAGTPSVGQDNLWGTWMKFRFENTGQVLFRALAVAKRILKRNYLK